MLNNVLKAILLFSISVFSSVSFTLDVFEDENVYWNAGRNVYFKFDDQDSSSTGKNDHPAKFNNKELSNALESLKIWEKDDLELDDDLLPVFTERQVALLGKHLEQGLRKATPEQDILFVLDKKRSRLLGLKTDVFYIAGRAFVKDDKLNIIIGDYNRPRFEGYERAYDPTNVGIVNYHFLHGTRSSSQGKFKENTIKVSGIENKQTGKRLRKDWFVIDVKTASESYLAHKKEKENPKTARDKQFEVEAAKLAKERREMRLEMARLRKEMKEGGGSSSSSDVEQRLEKLQTLKDKGLIDESDYNKRKQEILSEL